MLKYIKINSIDYRFKSGVNIVTCVVDNNIKDNNNIGKTTLIRIIKGIYGNKQQLLSSSIISKMVLNNVPCRIVWCLNVNSKDNIFNYNIDRPKVIFDNLDNEYSLAQYRTYIMELLDSEVVVLGKRFNSNLNFIKSSDDKNTFKQILDNESDTYNTLFALKLLLGTELPEFKELENYFSLVGRNENMKKSRTSIRKEIKRNSELDDIKEELENLHKLRTNRSKLRKLIDSKIDTDIIDQIKKIIPNINIDSIIEFQTKLYGDFNGLITEELEDLDKKINKIELLIGNKSTEKITKSDYKLLDAVQENIEFVEEELKIQTLTLADIRETVYNLGNDYLTTVKNQFKSIIELNEPVNLFRNGEGKVILKNMKFFIGLKEHSGTGHKLVNLTLVFTLFLIHSKIDICVLDTSQDSEISVLNFNNLINQISALNITKQIIFVTFKREIQKDENIIFNLTDENPLLGVKF